MPRPPGSAGGAISVSAHSRGHNTVIAGRYGPRKPHAAVAAHPLTSKQAHVAPNFCGNEMMPVILYCDELQTRKNMLRAAFALRADHTRPRSCTGHASVMPRNDFRAISYSRVQSRKDERQIKRRVS
jgi:hypothetical protein